MKYTISIFLVIILSGCSGTKRVVETQKPKEQTEIIVKTKDSIIQEKLITIINDSVIVNKDKTVKREEEIEKGNDFNQIVTKRFITTHQLWDELLSKHISDKGNVNYKSFKNEHKKLLDYINVLNLTFSSDDFRTFSKEDKLAYWINAYNAMTIDLILRNYPIKSIKDIDKPWDKRFWKLGEKWYNLNDIEHQILRKMDEPRIHFAIVCASISCPKLLNEAYNALNLNEQLTNVTKEFLSDTSKNNISENKIELSKIFQWFTKDFKQNGSLIDFLNQYSNIKISAKAKKSFKTYNWNLND
nr:DUF547 domain-containing protein [Gaetbulibacter sp. 4G1]